MKSHTQQSNTGISRRNFLKGAGGLTFFVAAGTLVPTLSLGQDEDAREKNGSLTAWVHLDKNGQIRIYSPAAEMGQGSMNALAVLIAEEMDAEWEKVTVEASPVEPEVYGMKSWGGRRRMITVGSFTVSSYFDMLRQAGAQARHVLLHSVSQKWNVPMAQLSTVPGHVIHKNF